MKSSPAEKSKKSIAEMKEVLDGYIKDETSVFNEIQIQQNHFSEYGDYDKFLEKWKKKIEDFIALKRRFFGYHKENCTKGKVSKVLFGEFTKKGDEVISGLMENTGVNDWADYKEILDDPDIET